MRGIRHVSGSRVPRILGIFGAGIVAAVVLAPRAGAQVHLLVISAEIRWQSIVQLIWLASAMKGF